MSERRHHKLFSTLISWSGWATASSGVLFLIWGYLDTEAAPWYVDLTVLVLRIVVPLFFLMGLVGLYIKFRRQAGWLSLVGFLISIAGAGWLAIEGVMNAPLLYRYLGEKDWSYDWTYFMAQEEECGLCLLWKLSLLLNDPLSWLFVGLSIVGLTTVRQGVLKDWGLLLLATALFGWVYQLTDVQTGIVNIRLIHVGFGILFCLSWMLVGYALLSSKNKVI